MTAEQIRAQLAKCDASIKRGMQDEEMKGYISCAMLFAQLEIAAQLAELNGLFQSLHLGPKSE